MVSSSLFEKNNLGGKILYKGSVPRCQYFWIISDNFLELFLASESKKKSFGYLKKSVYLGGMRDLGRI